MTTRRTVHNDKELAIARNNLVDPAGESARALVERTDQEPGNDSPDRWPAVGTEAFDALNRRRAELIDKDIAGTLEGAEREELEVLERVCGAAVDRAFPLPPVDLEGLIRLRANLRAEGEGRGG
jgi:hypothetical protein